MAKIPKNNLQERMAKLGYNPNLVSIKPPTLDNSKVVYTSSAPQPKVEPFFEPPKLLNIDDWSDFEDE